MPLFTSFAGNGVEGLGLNISKKPHQPQIILSSRLTNELQYVIANYDAIGTNYIISGTNAVLNGQNIIQSSLSSEQLYSLDIYVEKNGFVSETTSINNYTATVSPVVILSSKTSSSLTWEISNYDSSAEYAFNGEGTITQFGDLISQENLLSATEYSISITKLKNNIASETITSSLEYTEA